MLIKKYDDFCINFSSISISLLVNPSKTITTPFKFINGRKRNRKKIHHHLQWFACIYKLLFEKRRNCFQFCCFPFKKIKQQKKWMDAYKMRQAFVCCCSCIHMMFFPTWVCLYFLFHFLCFIYTMSRVKINKKAEIILKLNLVTLFVQQGKDWRNWKICMWLQCLLLVRFFFEIKKFCVEECKALFSEESIKNLNI